jgi:hypothetical protein
MVDKILVKELSDEYKVRKGLFLDLGVYGQADLFGEWRWYPGTRLIEIPIEYCYKGWVLGPAVICLHMRDEEDIREYMKDPDAVMYDEALWEDYTIEPDEYCEVVRDGYPDDSEEEKKKVIEELLKTNFKEVIEDYLAEQCTE